MSLQLRYGDPPYTSMEEDPNLLTQEIREKILGHQVSLEYGILLLLSFCLVGLPGLLRAGPAETRQQASDSFPRG